MGLEREKEKKKVFWFTVIDEQYNKKNMEDRKKIWLKILSTVHFPVKCMK